MMAIMATMARSFRLTAIVLLCNVAARDGDASRQLLNTTIVLGALLE